MTERNVTVRLRMVARQYISTGKDVERSTERVAASQRDLAASFRKASNEMDRASRQAETAARRFDSAGRRSGRGMLYAAAGVAALGAAGGGIKLLPGLLSATAVAGAALPPMLLGTAAAGGVLITSLKGVGEASGEVLKTDDKLAGLGKNARAVVAEVKRLQPAMSGVRQGFQDRTLEDAARNLNILATNVLPRVRGGLNELAEDWADAFEAVTVGVADPRFVKGFNTAAAGADWFFDLLNTRIPATLATVGTLVDSADPLARAFGESLINSLDRFNAAVDRAARSGSLEEYFARGAKGAGEFMAITNGVFRLVGLVISEVQKQGGTLEDTRASLDAYLASGRGAADVAGIVHTLTVSYEGLKDVLGPLGAMTRDALADPATADALATMFDVLAAGSRVLQMLLGLFQGLPGVVQSAILVMVAGAIVVSKLSKAFGALQAAADRGAASLDRAGKSGQRAGRGLKMAAAGAGAAVATMVGLQVVGAILDQFDDSAANMDALGLAVEKFGQRGQVGGELARLFGDDLAHMNKIAGAAAKDGWLTKVGLSAESLVPGLKSINEIFQGGSFTGSIERMKALDAELAQYARTTGDLTGAQELWNKAFNASGLDMAEFAKIMPSSTAELQRMQEAAHAGAPGLQATGERAKILAGSFQEAALAGKDLAATMDLINGKNISALEGQIKLEAAYDQAAEVVDKYGRVTKKGTHEINSSTDAGRQSLQALIGIQQAATAAADAEVKRTGNTAAGLPILAAARARFIDLATEMTGSAKAAVALADEIFKIPSKDVKIDAKTEEAVAKLRAAGYVVKQLPNGKWVIVKAKTDEAKRKLREAQAALDRINNKTVTLTVVNKTITRDGQRVTGGTGSGTLTRADGGVALARARGGYSVPYGRPIAAAMGLVRPDIYPASDPPLYQFAERETGGELFLPRRGIDRERGRALLAIAASWYGGLFVPMARGGVRVQAAASGLVNVAPSETTSGSRATRLDSAEAYLRARDAVAGLNRALKENGRSFALSTAKGRENRSAVYQAIQAAQDAARTKFEETGSVKAANRAYDEHIARLRATLKQQKVNSKAIRELLALAQRPSFTTTPPAPKNSLGNIAFARADIAVRGGLGELGDALSLNRAGIDMSTEHGRENLGAMLTYLEQAAAAAQARYEQTRNVKSATAYYESMVAQFRSVLAKAGYSTAMIAALIGQYGKITLTPNERGGVYMARAGGLGMLGQAAVYPGNAQPMYGWAEKSTGGELFVPRLGEQARGERLLAVGAGWYGGRYVPRGASEAGPTTINNNLTVHALRADLSLAELQGLMRQMDAQARVNRRK